MKPEVVQSMHSLSLLREMADPRNEFTKAVKKSLSSVMILLCTNCFVVYTATC